MAKRTRSRRARVDDGRIDWDKAAECFNRLLRERGEEIRRLCDDPTYPDLYLEDGLNHQ